MRVYCWAVPALLLAALALVLLKLWLLRKSLRQLGDAFDEKLAGDTNTLIGLSSRDRALRRLAGRINGQLRLLRAERRRFQQGDLELKESVTNLAHDLRTPLTALLGYLDLLEREEQTEASQRYLTQIRSRAEAMRTLTEEMLQTSLALTPQQLRPARLDLVRALEEALLSFYGAMEEKGIRPVLSLPEEPVWRELDPVALGRVLANITGNALKYAQGDLSVSMDGQGSICFANTAPALDPVTVGRLFDRYYTVEAPGRSTGLGLAIARTLTERMGGSIRAEYAAGELRVSLEFPKTS